MYQQHQNLWVFNEWPVKKPVNMVSIKFCDVPGTPDQLRGFFGQFVCHFILSPVNMIDRNEVKLQFEGMKFPKKRNQCVHVTLGLSIELVNHIQGLPKYLNRIAVFIPGKDQEKSQGLQFGEAVRTESQTHLEVEVVQCR